MALVGGDRRAGGLWIATTLAVAAIWLFGSPPARAVPAFAVQTGQPCQTCHVGGFGPQLTPYGRNFKLHGYTQRTGPFTVPISVMAVASYVRTVRDQPTRPAPGFGVNDNLALDQVSLFVAGGLGHLGAFIQTTYDGIAKAWTWDNLDLRATANARVRKTDIAMGASLNNNPTVQDPWNTLPAWGFPYTGSTLAPSPAAAPLLSGALAQTSLGLTGYAWINSQLYVEGGAYRSPGASLLTHLGADPTSPGDIVGLAPYGRIAVQKPLAGGTVEVGAVGFGAEIHPGLDRSTGSTDHYTDLGLDASFEKPLANGDIWTLNAHYLHEQQRLTTSCALAVPAPAVAPAGCPNNDLSDVRLDASYYWRNKVGFTVALFDTFGSANPTLYAANRTFRPDSSGATLQIDYTPFGGRAQPARRLNLRLGAQYTIYSRFDGARFNFDRAGANAADNNTFRVFSWLAF